MFFLRFSQVSTRASKPGAQTRRLASISATALGLVALTTIVSSSVPASVRAEGTPAPLTAHAALIQSGDQICTDSNERLAKAAEEYETNTLSRASGVSTNRQKVAKPKEVGEFIAKVALKEIDNTISQLAINKPSPEDKAIYDGLIKDMRAALAITKAKPEEAAWTDPFKGVSQRFVVFGFKVCGHNYSPKKK
jgi:hypothetical protein